MQVGELVKIKSFGGHAPAYIEALSGKIGVLVAIQDKIRCQVLIEEKLIWIWDTDLELACK